MSPCSQIATQAAWALPFLRPCDGMRLPATKQGPDYPGRRERLETIALTGIN